MQCQFNLTNQPILVPLTPARPAAMSHITCQGAWPAWFPCWTRTVPGTSCRANLDQSWAIRSLWTPFFAFCNIAVIEFPSENSQVCKVFGAEFVEMKCNEAKPGRAALVAPRAASGWVGVSFRVFTATHMSLERPDLRSMCIIWSLSLKSVAVKCWEFWHEECSCEICTLSHAVDAQVGASLGMSSGCQMK